MPCGDGGGRWVWLELGFSERSENTELSFAGLHYVWKFAFCCKM